MLKRPRSCYILTILWLLLSLIFINWGWYSISYVLIIPTWPIGIARSLYPLLLFGTTLSSIVWIVFACLFLLFSYGTFIGKKWVWTIGVILSSLFLIIFGLMLGSFMVTAIVFPGFFSIAGLNSVVVAFILDLGVIYFITRPDIKFYFKINNNHY